MTAKYEIRRTGRVVKVTVTADGEPICPHCGQTMVSGDGGESWDCPDALIALEIMRRGLAAAFDRAVQE